MARGKNIGGIEEVIRDEFLIRKIRGKFPNLNSILVRMIILFDKYNDQYEAELRQEYEIPAE